MKTLSSKLKINKFSPLQIGFIASFVLHSALFAFALDFHSTSEKSMKSQSINISLANIAGQNIHAQKSHKAHKKHHKKRKVNKTAQKESPTKQEPQKEQIAESTPKTIADSAVDSPQDSASDTDFAADSAVDSMLDSTLGASTNAGEKVEILGTDDALYATILDIINSARIYPKIAIIRKLQDDDIKVEFILHKSGEVQALRVISGKHRILNDNALDTIARASKKFPKPEKSKMIRMTISYDLI